ncbi:MAG TPA: hypothetical protein VLG40_04065 [Candidatus Saccharimonas sp.]|nr:hypothetical protein [Candidatus Saccharimonas sp.]
MKSFLSKGYTAATGCATLHAYLQHGQYELLHTPHSSYDTICGYLAASEAASVIAIDGPTNGGKTSLTSALIAFYERQGTSTTFIPLDYFLMGRETRKNVNEAIVEQRLGIADYSASAWEQERYRETVLCAKGIAAHSTHSQVLLIPHAYNRHIGTKDSVQSIIIQPGSIIITEGVGIHTYHGDFFDIKIRVDVHDRNTLLLKRVLERERQKPEGAPRLPDDFLQMRYKVVDAPHTNYLRANAPVADFVVDTTDFDGMLLYKHIRAL